MIETGVRDVSDPKEQNRDFLKLKKKIHQLLKYWLPWLHNLRKHPAEGSRHHPTLEEHTASVTTLV